MASNGPSADGGMIPASPSLVLSPTQKVWQKPRRDREGGIRSVLSKKFKIIFPPP
jgi:hypothetical protein